MQEVLLVILLIAAVAMVALILMQRSDGASLVSGGGPGGMMTARGAADFLTRATKWCAIVFISTALGLSIVSSHNRQNKSVVETPADKPVVPSTPQVPTGN